MKEHIIENEKKKVLKILVISKNKSKFNINVAIININNLLICDFLSFVTSTKNIKTKCICNLHS